MPQAGNCLEPAQRSTTIGGLLRWAASALRHAGIPHAGQDARRLMSAVTGRSQAELLGRPEQVLDSSQCEILARHVARRLACEPVNRILGAADFYGYSFFISPDTLDPRADSETVVAAALELIGSDSRHAPLRILDVGTGSGCLLLTLLTELPNASGVGTDKSEAAIHVARCNAARLGLAHRTAWMVGDTLEAAGDGGFDVLIANPPYIRSGDLAQLEPEVRDHDPLLALDGGADGLSVFRRLAARIPTVVPSGWVALEVGYDQADAVAALLTSPPCNIDASCVSFFSDLAGRRRCVAARTRN